MLLSWKKCTLTLGIKTSYILQILHKSEIYAREFSFAFFPCSGAGEILDKNHSDRSSDVNNL